MGLVPACECPVDVVGMGGGHTEVVHGYQRGTAQRTLLTRTHDPPLIIGGH